MPTAMPLTGRFLTLDAMRGVAAGTVLMIHMGGVPATLLPGGYLAVDLFFVLSGFVLAHAYGDGTLSFAQFITARLIRLYPLYLAGMVLGTALAVVSGVDGRSLASMALNVVFLPSPFGAATVLHLDLYPFNAPSWSLFFELLANICWFALLPLLSNRALALVLAIAAALLLTTVILFRHANGGSYWDSSIIGGFGRAGWSFFAGAATYRLWRAKAAVRTPPLVVLLILLVLFATPLPRVVFDLVATLVLFPALIWIGANCEPQPWARASFTKLGDLSYAVYALHFPVMALAAMTVLDPRFLRWLNWRPVTAHPSLLSTPLTIVTVLALSWVLTEAYDRPLRSWLSRTIRRHGFRHHAALRNPASP